MQTSDKNILAFGAGSLVAVLIGVKTYQIEHSSAFGVVTILGVVLALIKYLYEKRKDQNNRVIEQVKEFKSDVIYQQDNFLKIVRAQKTSVPKVNIISMKFEEICKDSEQKLQEQRRIALLKVDGNIIQSLQTEVLNTIEMFSIRVMSQDTKYNPELKPIHKSFVSAVESHAFVIFWLRDIAYGMPLYQNTLDLYFLWKDLVNSKSSSERLSKNKFWHDFIHSKGK